MITKGTKKDYKVNVIKDQLFFPNISAMAILQAVLDTEANSSINSVAFDFSIKVKNLTTGKIDTVSFNDYWTGQASAKNLYMGIFSYLTPIHSLIFNFFTPVEIMSVDTKIKVEDNFNLINLSSIEILNDVIHPGDKVKALVKMQNFQEKDIEKIIEIQIPSNVNTPNLMLSVASAKYENVMSSSMMRDLHNPQSYDQLIDILNMKKSYDELVVWLDIPRPGLIIDGKAMPNTPENILFLYGDKYKIGGLSLMIDRKIKRYKTNYLINGILMIPINVDLDFVEVD